MFDYRDVELRAQRYERIFKRRDHVVRKGPRYRGRSGRKLDEVEGLSRSDALHFLMHHPKGAALMQATDTPVSELADLLVEASQRAVNKRNEVSNMDSTTRMLKNVRSMGEAEYVRIVTDYARKQYPELSRERAFSKVFTAGDDAGQAIRSYWKIAKGGGIPADEPSDEDERDDDGDTDALEELETLAREERERNPKLTKAQAFTKIFTDPANAKLARRERAQNRPR